MKNKIFLIVFVIFIIFSSCKSNLLKKTRPNIIIIQVDDLGWDDLPMNGNKYVETPGIEKLKSESLNINRFYVSPVCSPTRASLLTGKDFLMTGVSHVHGGKDFLNLNEKTFADIFQAEGYKTGMWGKWHSGHTEGYYPWQRGFDEAFMARLYKHQECEGSLNGEFRQFKKWADEVIVDYAISFIEKSNENPFLAYLSFLSPHEPLRAKPELILKYKEKGLSEKLATLYAMIDQTDQEIKRLIAYLDNKNLRDNTLIIFMSDNGPAVLNGILTDEEREIRNNNYYKGYKGDIWENGVKSPLLISFPTKIKTNNVQMLCDVTDIFPTMADFAGLDLSKYDLNLTGKSFFNNLIEQNYKREDKIVFNYADAGWIPSDEPWIPKGIKEEYLPLSRKPELEDYQNQIISIITEDYKLLKNPYDNETNIKDSKNYVLIDIKNDEKENINLSEKNEKVFNDMKIKLQERFELIATSKHAFEPITFLLRKGKEKIIKLFAPSQLSDNLKIGFNFSYPWNEIGMFAEYQFQADSSMLLIPIISKKGNSAGIKFLIEIENNISNSIDINPKEIKFEPIKVEKGQHILKLSVISNTGNDQENEFYQFQFIENE